MWKHDGSAKTIFTTTPNKEIWVVETVSNLQLDLDRQKKQRANMSQAKNRQEHTLDARPRNWRGSQWIPETKHSMHRLLTTREARVSYMLLTSDSSRPRENLIVKSFFSKRSNCKITFLWHNCKISTHLNNSVSPFSHLSHEFNNLFINFQYYTLL